jgi:uncharacterized membrane protein
MERTSWGVAAPAITVAFLAWLVEVVEGFTIVLAVGTIAGWRPAIVGTLAGLALRVCLVPALGSELERVSIHLLQLVIGVLLLLFGTRWPQASSVVTTRRRPSPRRRPISGRQSLGAGPTSTGSPA